MQLRGSGWVALLGAVLVVGCSDDGLADAAEEEASTGAATGEPEDEADETDGDGATGPSADGSGDDSSGGAPDEPALPDFFQLLLTDAWGCDDLRLHLADPERTLMLTIDWPGLLGMAEDSGSDITWEVSFGVPTEEPITLTLQAGSDLDALTCMGDGTTTAEVAHSWSANAGVARLHVWPSALAPDGAADSVDLTLTSIGLVHEVDGSTAGFGELEVTDILVLP